MDSTSKLDLSNASQATEARPSRSRLALAFDHCPSVLFSFLSDAEAGNVASAVCALGFLKHYEVKGQLPFTLVQAGRVSAVVRRVLFGNHDDVSMLSQLPLPASVTSLEIIRQKRFLWARDLPRSLTHLHCHDPVRDESSEDWPPGLTRLDFSCVWPLPRLLPTLRSLSYSAIRGSVELPASLTTLKAPQQAWSISQLPPNLTALETRLAEGSKPQELADLPASLTKLTLYGNAAISNDLNEAGSVPLPASLRYLRLECFSLLRHCSLPESLEALVLDDDDPLPTHQPICHATLRTLVLPNQYNHPIRAADLPSLQELVIGRDVVVFNQPRGDLPGVGFNQPLDDLPGSLTSLTIRDNVNAYRYPLDHLPASLRILRLEREYDRPLHKLPASLRLLSVRHASDNIPLGPLPDSLTDLEVAGRFNHRIDRLPRNLRRLKLGSAFDQPVDKLPSGLTQLDLYESTGFDGSLDSLPETLEVLILPRERYYDNVPLKKKMLNKDHKYTKPLNQLPDSLTKLHLGGYFNQPLVRLPRGLTKLKLSHSYNRPLPLVAPEPEPSCMVVGEREQKQSLATCLRAANTDDSKSQWQELLAQDRDASMSYPTNLRSLYLGLSFNQPLSLSLPPTLTRLVFPKRGTFEHPLPLSSLPRGLTQLDLPRDYDSDSRNPEWTLQAIREQCPFITVSD